ncbi:hypothetical protein L484_026389 [Morus notabilis]|uniref:Uncharacterized protein n=1 Tax=Morus notabilis TaxID=981085 RepID=W9QYA3_9ROSA|nr:hypothetical protein L484_026389 [Morus notabilis]
MIFVGSVTDRHHQFLKKRKPRTDEMKGETDVSVAENHRFKSVGHRRCLDGVYKGRRMVGSDTSFDEEEGSDGGKLTMMSAGGTTVSKK